jgi:hypothetical protein
MIQQNHIFTKDTRICTHSCRKKMHHTQPTHRYTPNMLSTATHRHNIETHPSRLTRRQITPQPIEMEFILRKKLRTPANVHDSHRITKTTKPYNVLTALKISKNRYSNPSLSTNLGPNAKGKTVISLSSSNHLAQVATSWPHAKIRKKLPYNLLQIEPSQSIHRSHCSIVTHRPKAQLPSENNKDKYIQNTNKYETNVHR